MRLESVLFPESSQLYRKMARVLELTGVLHSPNTPLVMRYTQEHDREVVSQGRSARTLTNYIQNARKTKHHSNVVQASSNGDVIAFLDSDMMILGDLSPLEELSNGYDLCVTYHTRQTKFVFNSGLIVVRVSEATKELYRNWVDTAVKFMANRFEHEKYRSRYGGVNQCSLQHLMKTTPDLRVLRLETKTWNACGADHPFSLHEDKARVVHILAQLRVAIARIPNRFPSNHPLKDLSKLWHKYNDEVTSRDRTRSAKTHGIA